MQHRWALLACACLVAGRSGAQARPMTITDLITAVRVGDPQLSPDAREVYFSRGTTSMPDGKRQSEIWSVPTDGSARSHRVVDMAGANSPRLLPDGRLLFIATHDGAPQLFIAQGNGGDARVLTDLSGGVEAPVVVSPDGKRVAYIADVYPPCSDNACNARVRDSIANDPVQMHLLTGLPFRHWDEWWERVRHHVFVTDIDGGATRDVTPGPYDAPPHNYEDGAIAFSPDGAEIAFVSKHNADAQMWTTNHEIWIAPADHTDSATLVTRNPAADMEPEFTADGKSLVVRAQRRPGFESDRWYLDVYDLATHTKRTVFTTTDLSVDEYHLSPDGATIWFTAARFGNENVYAVPFAGGIPRVVTHAGSIGSLEPLPGGVVATRSTMTSPAEVVRVDSDGVVHPLTHENDAWLAATDIPKPESYTVHGALGTTVQYWVLHPPHFDASRRHPVVFLIHGGPQGDWPDGWSARWNPALWAAQGWVVVAPNPRGSTGFGQSFVDQISRDWCGKAMVDLDSVFAAVARMPYVDSTHMGIAGASYGGYAVDWIIGHTHRFKVAVTHDGVFDLSSMSQMTDELWFSDWEAGGPPWSAAARADYARCSPDRSANLIRTPTLVITNLQDFRVPTGQGLELFTTLRRNKVPSLAMVFDNEGHWVLNPLDSQRWHTMVFAWLSRYLDH